jgi:hypothetical protein
MAVAESGTRNKASAKRIKANPSGFEIGYSLSSVSIAQNGGGSERTPSTHGLAVAITWGQSMRVRTRSTFASTIGRSGR